MTRINKEASRMIRQITVLHGQYPSLSNSLALCFSLSQFLPVSVPLAATQSHIVCLCQSHCHILTLPVSPNHLCPNLSCFLSVSCFYSLALSLSLSLCLSLSPSLTVSLTVSLTHTVTHFFALLLSPSFLFACYQPIHSL